MIRRATTIVLGAGASMQFGFQSGEELTRNVVTSISNPGSREVTLLQELGHSLGEINAFREALLYSGKASVDAFLEHRESFLAVGKAAMACCLIPFEEKNHLFLVNQNWYQHLYAALNCKRTEFGANQLRIVTFNYDRSLEFYLHTCLLNSYGLSDVEAAKLLEHIPIVHVHGRLGRLPWQVGGEPERPYSVDLTANVIAAARDSIQVIHEGRYDDPALNTASALINEAEVVVFLGFGYHGPNVERLQIDLGREKRFFGGTGFGLKDLERQAVRRRFQEKLEVGGEHWNVLEFLRQRVELE